VELGEGWGLNRSKMVMDRVELGKDCPSRAVLDWDCCTGM